MTASPVVNTQLPHHLLSNLHSLHTNRLLTQAVLVLRALSFLWSFSSSSPSFLTFLAIGYFIRCDEPQSSRSTTSHLCHDPIPQALTVTSRPPEDRRHVVLAVNPGINEATITGFPKLLYSDLKRLHETRGSTSASSCSICLADYNTSDDLRLLPDCGHLFHRKCIDPWLLSQTACPICRTSPLPRQGSTPMAAVMQP